MRAVGKGGKRVGRAGRRWFVVVLCVLVLVVANSLRSGGGVGPPPFEVTFGTEQVTITNTSPDAIRVSKIITVRAGSGGNSCERFRGWRLQTAESTSCRFRKERVSGVPSDDRVTVYLETGFRRYESWQIGRDEPLGGRPAGSLSGGGR